MFRRSCMPTGSKVAVSAERRGSCASDTAARRSGYHGDLMNLPEFGMVRALVARFAMCLVCVVSVAAQVVWTKRPITNAPVARQVHDMVYDS